MFHVCVCFGLGLVCLALVVLGGCVVVFAFACGFGGVLVYLVCCFLVLLVCCGLVLCYVWCLVWFCICSLFCVVLCIFIWGFFGVVWVCFDVGFLCLCFWCFYFWCDVFLVLALCFRFF